MDNKIQKEINEFFNHKYKKYGNSPKSLGWSESGQKVRFELFAGFSDLNEKTLLDVGAGLGHFATFIQEMYPSVQYTGYDVNPSFVKEAKKLKGSFELRNVLISPPTNKFDVVFAIGPLNIKIPNNEQTMESMMETIFSSCKEFSAISMTSIYVDETHRDDKVMCYYDPCKIFSYAKTLTRNVVLYHHYLPHDFTIVMYKG